MFLVYFFTQYREDFAVDPSFERNFAQWQDHTVGTQRQCYEGAATSQSVKTVFNVVNERCKLHPSFIFIISLYVMFFPQYI